ncbi:MAG: hypothetical protein WCD89_22785 [Anaerocolumna sp.]
MAEYTQNYNLEKQQGNEFVSIDGLNGNFDIIDSEIKKVNDSKVNIEVDKGLSANDYTTAEKNKLSGIADNANNYTHPVTHPPAIIAQDANNRFISDTEKAAWNGKANATHQHSAGDISTGTLPILRGGTGQTTAAGARNALGLGNTTGALPVANGGTGATSAAAALSALGGALKTSPTITGKSIFARTDGTNSYNNGNIEMQAANNTPPLIGFHRTGVSAVGLYESGLRLYTTTSSDSTPRKVIQDNDLMYSTTDLTAGATGLAAGTFYFVYE